MFPKISSTNRRSAWAIREMDLFSSERSWGVFMRGIRAPLQNLSGNLGEGVVLNALRGVRLGFVVPPSASEKPIHLAQGRFPELEDRCEAGQLARDAAQLGRTFGRLGRSTALAGVFRHVLEAHLLSRAQVRAHGC